MNEKKIKIGLIGAGWIGSEHGRNVIKNPDAELTAIADEKKENVDKFSHETGIKPVYYKDYQELLKNEEVDAVLICSPNNLHAEMTVSAAQAGKDIMCEKPMAITLQDCKRIKEAVKSAGVKYLIGYHRRFNPLYQYARKLLDDGALGTPYLIESDYIHYVPGDWAIWDWLGKEKIAGSIFHGGCGHNIDLMRFFCGDVKEVSCFKDIFHPRKIQVETEDTAIAILRFENGAIGKCIEGLGAISPFTFNFSLYGTRGTVKNNKIWFDWIPKFNEIWHENDCITLPSSWIPDNKQGGIAEPWEKSINHFIESIVNDKPMANDAESAYNTSEVCFAAIKSAGEKTVVTLPL